MPRFGYSFLCCWNSHSLGSRLQIPGKWDRFRKERNILHTIQSRKADRFGHILRRNWFLKHITAGKIEGMIEVTGRRGRRGKLLLVDHKKTRGYRRLMEEAIDHTLSRTRFARGCGPVLRQNNE